MKKNDNKIWTLSFYAVLLAGLAMRCYQYFMGRSLWEDEAHLALNFMSRNFTQLLQPLDYLQAAPPLFLLTTKLFTVFGGYGPKALHFLPFVISILSLPLYYFLARKLTGNKIAALLAFLLFSVNIALIYFSSELKTYGVDVVMYTVMVWLALTGLKTTTTSRNVVLCLAGCLFIFYSNITFVIFFCIGCDMISGWIRNKKINRPQLYLLACWFTLYTAYYFAFIQHHPHTAAFQQYHWSKFPPLNPFSHEFSIFLNTQLDEIVFTQMLHISKGAVFGYILLVVFITGIIAGFRQKKYRLLWYSLTPVAVHYLVSLLHIYPFGYRFILYLIPGIMILMAYGVYVTAAFISRKTFPLAGALIAVACMAIFITPSVKEFPLWFKEIKPSLHYIDSFPSTAKLYITTPYTLYKYSYLNKEVHNSNYEAMQWPIGPEQYFETVGATQSDYLLLHATDTSTDGYGSVLRALKEKGLIKKVFEYKTFSVSLVRPLSSNEVILNYQSFPKDRIFDLNGKQVTALWDDVPQMAREIMLSRGNYEITVVSSGTPAQNIYPHINIMINDEKIHSYFTPADYGKETILFEQKNDGKITVKLFMDNDLADLKKHEDRNAFILYMKIKKVASP